MADARVDRFALVAVITSALLGCGATAPPKATAQATAEPTTTPPPASATSSASIPSPTPSKYVVREHAGAGVAFELGEGWELSGEESSTLLAASPQSRAVLMFHVAEPETLGAALAAIQKTLAAEVKDAYFGPAAEKKLGDLTVEYASGAGKLEERPVELGQLLVATPTERVLIVVAVIEAAASPSEKREARHTLESIRKTRSTPPSKGQPPARPTQGPSPAPEDPGTE